MKRLLCALLFSLALGAQTPMSSFLGKTITKQQTFLSTGTFTPSASLLAQGGWVNVLAVGGGSGGGSTAVQGNGGSGGSVVQKMVQVVGAVSVTIGGASLNYNNGASTQFGALLNAPGGALAPYPCTVSGTASCFGGSGSGGAGSAPQSAAPYPAGNGGACLLGYGGGGGGATTSVISPGMGACGAGNGAYNLTVGTDAVPNSGGGGGGSISTGTKGGGGGSGIVIVTWQE